MFNEKERNNLFLRQSCLDSWEEYCNWLESGKGWDYIVLTASNEAQAEGYRQEIAHRKEQGFLPKECEYIVLADPEGKRVGSGGATFNVLKYLACTYSAGKADVFHGSRILVIHSGGDSKRIPQYSVCGKLFSLVPRLLPDGRPSTLFDEFMVSMSAVAGRFREGMLVLSGDVLLLFNPLQLDFQYRGAAAISIKEPVSIGKNHGVFLNNGQGYVGRFLHKKSEKELAELGAVNGKGNVDLDTGAVLLDAELLEALYSLISVEGVYNEAAFEKYVNDKARISFYGDFLYPLATDSTLEDYYKEAPEGSLCQELLDCRTCIWEALSPFQMKLICLSPAQFIHFGTTWELVQLMTEQTEDYHYLDWQRTVGTNLENPEFAVYNSVISKEADIDEDCYIENSLVEGAIQIGGPTVISGLRLKAERGQRIRIPGGVTLHGVQLEDEKYVVRIYGLQDNPKSTLEKGGLWLGQPLSKVMEYYSFTEEDLWGEDSRGEDAHYLWFANLYVPCDTMKKAVEMALLVHKIFMLDADAKELEEWRNQPRMSLYSSFNQAKVGSYRLFNQEVTEQICRECFLEKLRRRESYEEALDVFKAHGISKVQFNNYMRLAEEEDFSVKIRIYYALAKYVRANKNIVFGVNARELEQKCFTTISQEICAANIGKLGQMKDAHIKKELVEVKLPIRVNFGGGWTDTPPYCNENGGLVLNAALQLNGINPIQVTVRRLKELRIEFASEDIGVEGIATSVEEIQDCKNPFDHFALHKAALLASGIIPMEGENSCLEEILSKLGGGIFLSTKVIGIPKGSGLGTSSILAGACIKALYEFMDMPLSQAALYDIVLCMEQIMSTGGGWQDQVGGLCPGIKMISSEAGLEQLLSVENVEISTETAQKLQQRFALIYTGQRRLARNLLRDVVGGYVGGRKLSVEALSKMKEVAVQMKDALVEGDIDEFAQLLNRHWELSLQLDKGASNTCIDQIFASCEDLICGKFICGAGGGGFLQVILKENVTKQMLEERLYEIFQDSGVCVWDSRFVL
ncbi:MAG: bifunctional fucokinase/L-fucose-1-P-guanylyltransferase [Lachnospiraceae bacterium]|nr:bifunctional fucokinase/L-fucose-1-P-guanylyltransferase [Lachnospiraceae bacterium]